MSGQAILNRRKVLKLSQDELSKLAKVSRPYLSQIENDERPGSVKVLKRIAAVLNIGAEELFSTSELSGPKIDEASKELLSAFAKLNETDRNSVLRHATTLAQMTAMKGILK